MSVVFFRVDSAQAYKMHLNTQMSKRVERLLTCCTNLSKVTRFRRMFFFLRNLRVFRETVTGVVLGLKFLQGPSFKTLEGEGDSGITHGVTVASGRSRLTKERFECAAVLRISGENRSDSASFAMPFFSSSSSSDMETICQVTKSGNPCTDFSNSAIDSSSIQPRIYFTGLSLWSAPRSLREYDRPSALFKKSAIAQLDRTKAQYLG